MNTVNTELDTPPVTNKRLTTVIMQPTYLPWVGYFDLMDQADVFIYLDSVQFAKRSWQQRNRIKTPQGELMLTVPVLSKGARDQTIAEAKIDFDSQFQRKHLKSIEGNYCKAPFFREFYPSLQEIYSRNHSTLADLNIDLIEWIAKTLGIASHRIRATQMHPQGHKVDLLISLCKEVSTTEYLSPPGSKVYIDEDNRFAQEGIELRYQQYAPVPYQQCHGEFLPYMSALDALMNIGANDALALIRKGRQAV